jgi:hypothetical protein
MTTENQSESIEEVSDASKITEDTNVEEVSEVNESTKPRAPKTKQKKRSKKSAVTNKPKLEEVTEVSVGKNLEKPKKSSSFKKTEVKMMPGRPRSNMNSAKLIKVEKSTKVAQNKTGFDFS